MKRIHSFLILTAVLVLFCLTQAQPSSVVSPSLAAPPQPMQIHYINVGQAEAILLEFPKAAVMIDAGVEETNDLQLRNNLMNYLRAFFQRRTDLRAPDGKGIIDTLIVSHPHIDHTRRLFDVVQTFRVNNLIDGGANSGSGIGPMREARDFVREHGGKYLAVKDSDLSKPDFKVPAFEALRAADPNVGLRLLGASRGCVNGNNDSLVLMVGYKARKFIFTGDAESEPDENCTDEISMLIERYQGSTTLRADVYKVNHHGSFNGTTPEWMLAIRPRITVISAGQHDPAHRVPGVFHAWQFGHPRASAVLVMKVGTSGFRTPKRVNTMKAVKVENPAEIMRKAVYCTCWDGDIVIDGTTLQVRTSQ